jgi:hypothetical protein
VAFFFIKWCLENERFVRKVKPLTYAWVASDYYSGWARTVLDHSFAVLVTTVIELYVISTNPSVGGHYMIGTNI